MDGAREVININEGIIELKGPVDFKARHSTCFLACAKR